MERLVQGLGIHPNTRPDMHHDALGATDPTLQPHTATTSLSKGARPQQVGYQSVDNGVLTSWGGLGPLADHMVSELAFSKPSPSETPPSEVVP